MKEHLYEISKDFMELQEAANNAESVDESMMLALKDTMEGLQLSFEEKAQNIVNVMKNVAVNVDAIDDEIKRLQARKATIKNKEEWFREYLRSNMEKTGINKIECEFFTITLAKSAAKVEITNESLLPDDLIDIETKIKPRQAQIKERLNSGEDVPGATLIDSKRRLIIK